MPSGIGLDAAEWSLIEPRLSGTGARHTRAVQEHQHYFQLHPTDSERDYLEHLFTQLSALPAMEALFDHPRLGKV